MGRHPAVRAPCRCNRIGPPRRLPPRAATRATYSSLHRPSVDDRSAAPRPGGERPPRALVDGGLDADHLAMAAWIAPSGANQSAWLHRAREGADARTQAFVDRRSVERHLQAGLADWAMATLRGAK